MLTRFGRSSPRNGAPDDDDDDDDDDECKDECDHYNHNHNDHKSHMHHKFFEFMVVPELSPLPGLQPKALGPSLRPGALHYFEAPV